MFATAALARRIDLVEARLVRAIVVRVQERCPEAGAFAEPVAGGWALFAGRGNPVNKVIGIGFDAVPDPGAYAGIERAFRERGAQVRAEVATLARAETHEWLSRRGYALQGFENVLGRPLGRGPASDQWPASGEGLVGGDTAARGQERASGGARSGRREPGTGGASIDVRQAAHDEIDTWVATVTAGFASPDESGAGGDQPLPPDGELAATLDDVFRAGGMTRYLARVDGAVAGGAAMRIDESVALLAGAATLPEFRRRGVQRALLEARLADAARAGCELAVVVTQPGSTSQANVQRQGFHLLYARAVLCWGG
jgi:GNAT superfamily N-acetyltransferase